MGKSPSYTSDMKRERSWEGDNLKRKRKRRREEEEEEGMRRGGRQSRNMKRENHVPWLAS